MISPWLRSLLFLPFVFSAAVRSEPHAALGAAVETNVPPNPRYPGKEGVATLVDGVVAETSYGGGMVVGFEGIDVEITIRLDEPIQVRTIAADFVQITQPAIYLPASVDFAVSENGTNFRTVATVGPKATEQDQGPLHERFQVTDLDVKVQAVRVRVGNGGNVPPDHRAPQALRWTFVSEVLVNPGDKPVSVWDAVRRHAFGASRTSLARIEGLLRSTAGEEREAVLAALHDLLGDGQATDDARRFACEMLGLHGGAAAVPALARALASEELLAAAAQALSALAVPEAEKALLAALGTAPAKAPVIGALARFRTPATAAALAPLLADDELGGLAARSLAAVGGPLAVQRLAAQLAAVEDEVRRQWLGQALLVAADDASLPAPVRIEALRQVMAQGTKTTQLAGAGVLLRRHDDPAALARILLAGQSLGTAWSSQAVTLLGDRVEQRGIVSLGDGFAALPTAARCRLIGRERDQRWLLARVADDNAEIRMACIRRLGECGDGQAVAALAARLAVPPGPERQALVEALANLRGAAVAGELLAAAKECPAAARPALTEIFRQRQVSAAGPLVLAWVRDASLPRAEGWRALAELAGPELLAPLVEELAAHPADRPAIGKALFAAARRGTGSEDGKAVARRLAQAEDAAERDLLVQALGILGNREALRTTLADPDLAVRLSAARALGECGDRSDIDRLLVVADTDEPRQNALALRSALGILARVPAADGAVASAWLARASRCARRAEDRALVDAAWVQAAETGWPDAPAQVAEPLARVAAESADPKLQARARTVLDRLAVFGSFLPALAERPWQTAFNGKDLAGWRPVGGKPESWTVADGLLVANAGGGGWLARSEVLADYLFELEFRLGPGGNSGFFLRPPLTGNPAWEGIEVQLLDDAAPQYAGKLRGDQYCASIYGMGAAQPGISLPAGQWQRLRVLCAGRHVAVWLNGQPISYAALDEHMDKVGKIRGLARAAGFPGLQNEHGPIQFRNLRLRDLR